jgi:hypothetical protein
MRFFGKNYVREDAKPDPKGEALGTWMEKQIETELTKAAAGQRALQAAKAKEANRRREEDKAVAAMLKKEYEWETKK